MTEIKFNAELKRPEGVGTWTYVDIPKELMATFGNKGQLRVRGTVNGYSFRSSAMPHGDGTHYLVINRVIREAIGAIQGDTVRIILQPDLEERKVTPPEDLAKALDGNQTAKSAFQALSYSHQKQYVEWIESAQQSSTREKRIVKTIEMLPLGWNPKRGRGKIV
jgi:hypothetical protein